jgi:hypothetical protein
MLSYNQREKKTSEEGASTGACDGQGLMVNNNHGGKIWQDKERQAPMFSQ